MSPVPANPADEDSLVWYVSYGSNMNADRLACYLQGGRPPGAMVGYTGARDRTPPRADAAVMLPGRIHFATHSEVWGGGIAFYDPEAEGPTPARAFLITPGQFADVAAQEMHRAPSEEDPLERVVREGLPSGRHQVGPGKYETMLRVGEREGRPLLTFTAPDSAEQMESVAPTDAYLAMLTEGLRQSHGWQDDRIAAYFRARGATVPQDAPSAR
jgi:hypothetical protein